MVERKRTKEQTTIYKTLHRKQKIGQQKLNNGGMVSNSCPTRRITLVANPVISHECGEEREMLRSDHL